MTPDTLKYLQESCKRAAGVLEAASYHIDVGGKSGAFMRLSGRDVHILTLALEHYQQWLKGKGAAP